MNGNQRRVPAGTPAGGRFATQARAEAAVRLPVAHTVPSSEAFGDQPSVPDSIYLDYLDQD